MRRWRAPDLGPLRVFLEAAVPRVRCPQHRVVLAGVPWARHGADVGNDNVEVGLR